jgi:hypothetical protein
MDEYGGVGPWISSIYPFSILYGWRYEEDVVGPWIPSISFLHIYLWMNVAGLVPGFPLFILYPFSISTHTDDYCGVGQWLSSIYPFSISTYGWLWWGGTLDFLNIFSPYLLIFGWIWWGLVPGFHQFILSQYLLMDDYDGVGPWISSVYPFSISTYGWLWWGRTLDFLNIFSPYLYLWMNMVGLVPGFP